MTILFAALISFEVYASDMQDPGLVLMHDTGSYEINHSGRTRKDGCHKDRKRGGEHCH